MLTPIHTLGSHALWRIIPSQGLLACLSRHVGRRRVHTSSSTSTSTTTTTKEEGEGSTTTHQRFLRQVTRATLLLGGLALVLMGRRQDTKRIPLRTQATHASSHPDQPLTRYSIANAAEMVAPSVVSLVVEFQGLFGLEGRSWGSGFIISRDGTIITNAHVVSGGGVGPLTVMLADGRKFNGTVLSLDEESDLAVVQITSDTPLPSARLGRSADLRPGEWIVAVGSPLTLRNTITAGIVSNVEREGEELGIGRTHVRYIQTDAAINQGNSGGPLVNLDGEVVGVATMRTHGEGVSLAIAADDAREVVNQLLSRGYVFRPYLGILLGELDSKIVKELRRHNSRFPNVEKGLVVQVVPGEPAHRSGIRDGDVIVEVGGSPVGSVRELLANLPRKPNMSVDVKLLRDGTTHVVAVTPADQHQRIQRRSRGWD